MRRLQTRVEDLARAQQRRAIARIAERLSERLRGADIQTSGDTVTVGGKHLVRRWLLDPSLRFVAELGR